MMSDIDVSWGAVLYLFAEFYNRKASRNTNHKHDALVQACDRSLSQDVALHGS
jgi:hypothetical protein